MKKLTVFLFIVFTAALTAAPVSASCYVAALMYHDITPDEQRHNEWCISPATLEEDINYFTDNGYITLTASELANESMDNLEGKKILLLTFDDGYAGWYTDVYPILQRTRAKATMFIVGAYINRYGYMSEDEIREMANSGLVEIGSHTDHIHQMLREPLIQLYDSGDIGDVLVDIGENTRRLTEITGKKITSIAWPYGYSTGALNSRVRDELGYTMIFSTDFGVNYYSGDSDMLFKRVNRDYDRSSSEMYNLVEDKFS